MAKARQLRPATQGRYMILGGVRLLIATAIGVALTFGVNSVSIAPAPPPPPNSVCHDGGCMD